MPPDYETKQEKWHSRERCQPLDLNIFLPLCLVVHGFSPWRDRRDSNIGAVDHVMARVDGGKSIFTGKENHEAFLHGLERVCVALAGGCMHGC